MQKLLEQELTLDDRCVFCKQERLLLEGKVCLSCHMDIVEEVDYDSEWVCQVAGCHRELEEEWETDVGMCTEHQQEEDMRELEHPDRLSWSRGKWGQRNG